MPSRRTYIAAVTTCLTMICLGAICPTELAGQWSDSFEGGEPRWELVESDCQAQLTEHGISLLMPHGGRTCEMFEVACTHGTLALLAYPIEPCAVLNEFQPRLWIRCSSGRIQLGVRVIFPFAAHPATGGRLKTILWGDVYADTGQWQQLQVDEMAVRLNEDIVKLRQRFEGDLDLAGAYIDCLVLNAYTGPGRYRVQLDDLELRGMIPMAATGQPPPPDWRERWRWRHELPTAEERYWAAPNRPPVWMQHRGEPLSWVRSLGFTGILTNEVPSQHMLAKTKQAGLGLIASPPPYPVQFSEEALPALKGWLIGAALDSRLANVAREQAQVVAKFPTELRRPLIAEALEDHFLFSRIADELIVPAPSPTAAGTAGDKLQWLSEQLHTTGQRGEGWVAINVGLNPTVAQQITMARQLLLPTSSETTPTQNPLGLRHQVTTAVIAGAQGIFFRTFDRLDTRAHPLQQNNVHAAALRWINNDLQLWGPWIVGGELVRPPAVNDNRWRAAAWRIDQSHLILAQNATEGSEYVVPPTQNMPLEIGYPLPTSGQQVFRLTHGRLERVEAEASPAGVQWRVDRPAPVECFLVTSTPTVMRFVRRQLQTAGAQNAADQLEICAHNLNLASQVVAARFPQIDPAQQIGPSTQIHPSTPIDPSTQRSAAEAYLSQLSVAQNRLEQGWQALRTDQVAAATQLMYRASDVVQTILYESHQVATSNLASPQASPFVVSPGNLGLHWQLARACERSQWTDLQLPGGEFASLPDLLDAGWSQQRRLEERVDLRVELVPAAQENSAGLRLAAYAKPELTSTVTGGYAGASLRVRSASMPVRAGQLVRVAAQARVIRGSPRSDSGLLVYDNQVGPNLGQLVTGAEGSTQSIELYRFIVEDGPFRILAECRGECDIVLESVRASVISPATNRRSFVTSPRNLAN